MAKPRKVGKRWKMEVRRKGVHKYATFDTKAEAMAWGKETERLILGGAAEYSKNLTFEQACHRYLREVSISKKGWRWENVRIKKFLNDGLGRHLLFNMDSKFWKDWIARQTISPASINRELNLISAVFEYAKYLELIETNPIRGIKRPKNPKHRDRRISDEEIRLITESLGFDVETMSGQTSIAFLLAIETGMRRGELLSLELDNVNLDSRFVTLVDTKNGDKRDVPLSSKAVELLDMLGSDLFTVAPETLTQLFRRACRRLGIEDLNFHDTRHEAVSRLARKLDVMDLARMIGHRDLKSLMVYYNATASEIAKRLD